MYIHIYMSICTKFVRFFSHKYNASNQILSVFQGPRSSCRGWYLPLQHTSLETHSHLRLKGSQIGQTSGFCASKFHDVFHEWFIDHIHIYIYAFIHHIALQDIALRYLMRIICNLRYSIYHWVTKRWQTCHAPWNWRSLGQVVSGK